MGSREGQKRQSSGAGKRGRPSFTSNTIDCCQSFAIWCACLSLLAPRAAFHCIVLASLIRVPPISSAPTMLSLRPCCCLQAVDSGKEREDLFEDWVDEKEKLVGSCGDELAV